MLTPIYWVLLNNIIPDLTLFQPNNNIRLSVWVRQYESMDNKLTKITLQECVPAHVCVCVCVHTVVQQVSCYLATKWELPPPLRHTLGIASDIDLCPYTLSTSSFLRRIAALPLPFGPPLISCRPTEASKGAEEVQPSLLPPFLFPPFIYFKQGRAKG